MRDDLIALIVSSLEELRDAEQLRLPLELNGKTALFGEEGVLDSLALVTLVVSLEQAIEDKFGVSVSLADEKALSQANSPYRTVASLADYASSSLEVATGSG